MAERNIQFQVDQNDVHVDNDGNNGNQDPPPNPPQNVQAPQVVVPAGAPGAPQATLAFKVEQSKLPKFFGQKGKDNIMAIVFIRIIDDLARTNRWNDTTTYTNVANTLKGFARDWLFATMEMLDWTADQLTWTNLKPRFQRQFATQMDKKMIIEGLSNLAMKPSESTGLLARITNTMVILKESYASYENKPAAPSHHHVNGGFTMPLALNNAQQFLKMQLFRAALPAELRKVVAQRNPNTLTLDDMYQNTTDTQREARPKIKQAVAAVRPEGRDYDEGDEEEGFQKHGQEEELQPHDEDKLQNHSRTWKQC
jgi:hypothetical protein